MDNSVILVLLAALTVTSGAGPVATLGNDRVVIDVCIILNQDHSDIGMCCDKARGNSITSGEVPSITYLCCLGYFQDVKVSYMTKITFDLILYIVKNKNAEESLLEAEFIAMCADDHSPRLTLMNYLEWKGSDQSLASCRRSKV